ncbi:hypothetical protein NF672_08465 [Pseudomonas moraviensis]|uniref:hypothetical protein n=1 Tax=Pseudomonas moraviensis TaxID=321662 RepID=UPI0020936189|nr:hypothetical protein [Pseudomonas moraviensis]UST60565.1 hypothetical protein NF672_08465 [Pseudomonas moraviensis]
MTKTSNKRDDEKERDLMRSAQESPDAGNSVDWTAIKEKVLCREKKARWGDGLETCFLTDGFTLR